MLIYNGTGWKIENNETVIEATIRECNKETKFLCYISFVI